MARHTRLTHLTLVGAALLLALGRPDIAAAQAGEWRLGGRLISIHTSAETDAFGSGDSVISFDDAVSVELNAATLVTDDWAVEMMLTTAPHDLSVTRGGLAGLDVGRVWVAQSTVTLQYHVPLWGRWRPYVGAGIGLAWLHSPDTRDLARLAGMDTIRSDVFTGVAAQVGVSYRSSRRWILSLDVTYSGAAGTIRLVRSDGTTMARPHVSLDPVIVGIGAAYRF